MKQNCWEFKKCGREPNGSKVKDLGVCHASICEDLNGVHDGKNGGRACWVIAGTLCKGEIQGSFANKLKNCLECDFYKLVKEEEDSKYKGSAILLNMLKK